MEGTYPVMIDGALAGKLSVRPEGAMTVFEAECVMLGGIVRLSVYGGGKEGYLGVLMPSEDGKLRLRKALSRSAMREFPTEIDYAGRAGEAPVPEAEPVKPQKLEETAEPETTDEAEQEIAEPETAAAEDDSAEPPPTDLAAESDLESEPEGASLRAPIERQERAQKSPEPVKRGADDVYWYSSPDGELVSFDGERAFLALPQGDKRMPKKAPFERRVINGTVYSVYITKDGRIADK